MTKWVYSFGDDASEGAAEMRNLLGGKGANLAEMSNLGLPVPPGFTITTDVCTYYYGHEQAYPSTLKREVAAALVRIEKQVGTAFGDAENPLLVSVRSGARVSMPGMMDTVLNLGLNDRTVAGLAARIPVKIAMELMLLGEPIDAERAHSVGLINRVVPDGAHIEAAKTMAHTIAGYAPLVTTALKQLVGDMVPVSATETAYRTKKTLDSIMKSDDLVEGVAAFKEKRPPKFTGS